MASHQPAKSSRNPAQGPTTTRIRSRGTTPHDQKNMLQSAKPSKSTRVKSSYGLGKSQQMRKTNDENANPNIITPQIIPQATIIGKKAKLPAYMQSLNSQEKEENFKIIDNMNKKISYKKNPRFRVNKAPLIMTEVGEDPISKGKCPFRMEPRIVQFTDYQVNGIYELPLKIINGSETLQRVKIGPPSSMNFTIRNVVYPNDITGDIAPGLCATVYVNFIAPSFADYDDYITIVTDNNSFRVPLRARRDPPVINLQNPMNCLHSWIGDRVDMAFRCQNTGGDGGFKFFCEKDEDDQKQTDPGTLRIGAFSVTPAQFYLNGGNAIDIYVSFSPLNEGQTTESLILACDNNTSESFQVTGYGAMLDVEVIEVDGRLVDFKINPFKSLPFPNTNPTSISTRKIKIKNSSPILVPFHWSIFKNKNSDKISIEDDPTHYKIEPSQGKIPAGQIQEFTLSFTPEHAEPYFEFCDFIIEDLPIQCVRDPPEGLLQYFEASQSQKQLQPIRHPMPHYVGSNTQYLSIPLVSFSLVGQGNSCQVSISHPILTFEGDLFINCEYKQKVKLRKEYRGSVFYKLQMEGKSSNDLEIDLLVQSRSLTAYQNMIKSEIKPSEDEIEIEVSVLSKVCGDQTAFFYIEIADGAPITFQCKGYFRGPQVKIIEPVIDFGLIKVNTKTKYRLSIENTSPIPSEILIRCTRNTDLTFETCNQLKHSKNYKKTKTLSGNSFTFSESPLLKIAPNSRIDVLFSMKTKKPESFLEFFELIEKQSPLSPQYFQVMAEIQKPQVCLSKTSINLGKIYAGVPELIDRDRGERSLTLKNYGNIAAQFQWEEHFDQDKIVARFEPLRGIIPPKSEIKISIQTTIFYGGLVDELFICNIEDIGIPLGVEFKAESFGLNVSYETAELQRLSNIKGSKQSRNITLNGSNADIMNNSMLSGKHGLSISEDHISLNKSMEINMLHSLKMFSFAECLINKASQQKFILKNLSGIRTKFKLTSRKFEPISHQPPQRKPTEAMMSHDSQPPETFAKTLHGKASAKHIKFAPSTKSAGSNSFYGSAKNARSISSANARREKPILTDEHEETQKFSSKTGETHTQTKRLEKEASFFLSNNKGISIVFNPQIGELPPHSEIPITVTVYNNICGKFEDQIISEVRGLETVEFPISIGIKGSPVEIPYNQVGVNYKTVPPTLPFPTQIVNTQPVTKEIKVRNTGIRAVEVNWKIYDARDLQNFDRDLFNLSIAKNQGPDRADLPFKFAYEFIEPEESFDSIYEIEPKEAVMGPREVKTYTVTFRPSKMGAGMYRSIVMATPNLTQDELQIADDAEEFSKKGSLGIVSFNIYGENIPPVLTIDKKSRVDGFNHMNFKYWSYRGDGDAPNAVQKLTYTNDTKADICFNLEAEGPFEIVKTKSNTNAKHPNFIGHSSTTLNPNQITKHAIPVVETFFNLQPLKILEVHLKFKSPGSSNTQEWPLIMKSERHGELLAHFTNGDTQKLILDAFMLRPMIRLLTDKPQKNDYAMDELQFGTIHVESHKTVRIFLTNVTEVTAKWRLNYVQFPRKSTIGYATKTVWEGENLEKCDDPDVFEFSVTDGSLKGKSLPLRKLPEGLLVPPVPKDQSERDYMPQTILINFRVRKFISLNLYLAKTQCSLQVKVQIHG